MIKLFAMLLAIANDTGTVTSANLYESGFIDIAGKTEDGKKFSITMNLKEEEKNGESV